MLFLGIDLAWAPGSDKRLANESGIVALEPSGRVVEAGWTVGLPATADWANSTAEPDSSLFVDAPLIVDNEVGTARLCERQVSACYMHPWKVGANSTHPDSPRLGGVELLARLEHEAQWRYADGGAGPRASGRVVSECYPWTTIVGTPELGYELERPLYKRKPRAMPAAEWRPLRAAACDELIRRVARLCTADPPLDLRSHPATKRLVEEPSPPDDAEYKAREDLLDAALCAWTASLWARHGTERCQVLGLVPGKSDGRAATIIAPARPEQRLHGPGATRRRTLLPSRSNRCA